MTDSQLSSVVQSSARHDWATPQKWFEYLDLEFNFTIDVCASPENAKCERFYTADDDGLKQSWAEERVFMNPPYGREIAIWMQKAYIEARNNLALVVCLVPARVETQWWHKFAVKGEVRFPVGRLQFNECGVNAPFPCAIVIFRPRLSNTQPGFM
jgi:phage N-6-adenine-methyltransferase